MTASMGVLHPTEAVSASGSGSRFPFLPFFDLRFPESTMRAPHSGQCFVPS